MLDCFANKASGETGMAKVEWSDKYLLGVKKFDSDHEHLFDLMNKSHDLMENTAPDARLEVILDELFDYAAYHFNAEEVWMHEHIYPNLDEHIAEHDNFRKRFAALQNDFQAFKTTPKIKLYMFLLDWLTNHILTTDFQYARFVAETRNSAASSAH
jgi:hemerythrin